MLILKTEAYLCLLESSANNLCNKFGPDQVQHFDGPESKLFDTLVVFLKVIF